MRTIPRASPVVRSLVGRYFASPTSINAAPLPRGGEGLAFRNGSLSQHVGNFSRFVFWQFHDRIPQVFGWTLGVSVPHHPIAPGASSDKEAGKMWFVGHFVLPLRTIRRAVIAMTVRFSFRAIKISIFEFSSAKSCASSSSVHGRPLGRGPSFI
jgi:hypothetical protein